MDITDVSFTMYIVEFMVSLTRKVLIYIYKSINKPYAFIDVDTSIEDEKKITTFEQLTAASSNT